MLTSRLSKDDDVLVYVHASSVDPADWWQSFQQGNRVAILAYRRDEVDQFNTACQQLRDLVALMEHGPARWLRRGDLGRVREQATQAEAADQVARQAADRAADRERAARHQQQQYQAYQEANPDLADRRRELLGVQAWRPRRRPRGRAAAARVVAGAGRAAYQRQGWPCVGPGGGADHRAPAAVERGGR
jgi:hypothetical protein